ncbi:hypothetical protein TSTA_109310 [Talaromyces stipitatus ATCC 10500]|uniref:RNase H type-1 domain-containing protein n=1 Tax=Talaromyces stipitatus (strain ATCC 10500 / CBS 375.48 / QM 6759 / NRRL 1006) TaxID=441959 RepID=B8MV36_TALSN|nr:uncharacterized protein TSTA_109310 [Talaromyces stipitatus ATCC 10500]EED11752.1 hypothetical protein TSTA_109310 [Talaromyces stipitatus ATCC 10500]
MRQLYQACVTLIVDYASTVWHNPLKDKIHLRMLGTVQRTTLICILSAFKTASTAALEVEAYVLPTNLRLKQRAQIVAARLSTLPEDHPGQTINPTPPPPWQTPAFVEIDIEPDRDKAKDKASARQKASGITVFFNASGQQNALGAAAVALDQNHNIIQHQKVCIGSIEYWSVYTAELMAIYYAISLVLKIAMENQVILVGQQEPATILSDSMSALQAISNTRNKSGQRIIQAVQQAAQELKARGIPLCLQWMPGHCDNPGNEAANRLAKEAVSLDKEHPFQHLLSREKGFIRNRIQEDWEQGWRTSKNGGHLRRIDRDLPAVRTRRIEDDKCECGAIEIVVHVLIHCPKLKSIQQELRKKIGTAFNNISDMLGGGSQGKQDSCILHIASARGQGMNYTHTHKLLMEPHRAQIILVLVWAKKATCKFCLYTLLPIVAPYPHTVPSVGRLRLNETSSSTESIFTVHKI